MSYSGPFGQHNLETTIRDMGRKVETQEQRIATLERKLDYDGDIFERISALEGQETERRWEAERQHEGST